MTQVTPVRPGAYGLPADDVRPTSSPRKVTHFVRHFLEMCLPMCIGFAVGDLVYFWAAATLGYSEPFKELPELSLLVVTFSMTAPMAGWMRFRGMPRRAIGEMSATMPALAIALLVLAWSALVSRADLALLEHALMMPAMLVPMLLRLEIYTGGSHHTQAHHGSWQ
jgi:hypothetical protein